MTVQLITEGNSILGAAAYYSAEADTAGDAVAEGTSAGTTSASSTPATEVTASTILQSLLPWVILLALLYFIMLRPQKKKEKETKSMRDNLQVGDEILTIGGIVGIIVRKQEDTVVIETGGDRSKLRIKSWAIQENLTVHEQTEMAKPAKKSAKEDSIEDIETAPEE